jgi:hypothetical protein
VKGWCAALGERLGWIRRPPQRTVIFAVPDAAACDEAEHIAEALRGRYERLCFAYLAKDKASRARLQARFPRDLVFYTPWPLSLCGVVFLLTSRARMIAAVRGVRHLHRKLARRIYFSGLPLVVIDAVAADEDTAAGASRSESRSRLAKVDWYEPRHPAAAADLRLKGVPADRIGPAGSEANSRDVRTDRIIAGLMPYLARRPPARRLIQRAVIACVGHPVLRRLIKFRVERIDTLEEFRRALGNPEILMCLGSGPSSEMIELRNMDYDRLFRVNHRWIDRGIFDNPYVVFTGHKRTLFTVKAPFIAFQTKEAESQLVTHQVFNPLCRRMRYVTLERFGLLKGLDWGGFRPTHGAGMLAAAVALQPRRLIVGGIDLFQDQAGTYPGDSLTPNAYVPAHDRDLEKNFVLETLAQHRGELVLVGDVLNRAWREYRQGSDGKASAQ